MDEKFIIAIDQGTTSSRAMIFNKKGQTIATAQREFAQIYTQTGWVEHDPEEIWSTQLRVVKEVLQARAMHPAQIETIGITNQRETTVVWEKSTGKPIYNAIVWQDRRTSAYCKDIIDKGYTEMIQEKTGLRPDAYFSATKIKWILERVPGAMEKAKNGDLAFGTIDSWLMWKLTNGLLHITDVSNASRTMLYNIHTLEWDHDLLRLMRIPPQILPQVRSSSEKYGYTAPDILGSPIAISAMAGDQHAALFGQLCTKEGMVKNTYGTGCFMLMNTGNKPILSPNGLLTSIAWKIGDEVQYVLEGSIFMGGAIVQWLRDELKIIKSSAEVEALAMEVAGNDGVYLVPAFAGLGAPYWDSSARGTILGLSRGTGKTHIARAALESIAYQSEEVFQLMEKESGINIREVRVDGGASVNNFLMQFQADIIGKKITRPQNTESTALGVAYLAGLATGYWKNMEELENSWNMDHEFTPGSNHTDILKWKQGWQRAVQTVSFWSRYSDQ